MRALHFLTLLTITACAAPPAPSAINSPPGPEIVPAGTLNQKAQSNSNEKFERAKRESEAALADHRRKAGFPPENDMVGTLNECEKRLTAHLSAMDQCVAAAIRRYSSNLTEPAEILARAVISDCRARDARFMQEVGRPFCYGGKGADVMSNNILDRYRERALAEFIRRRTPSPHAPAAQPKPKSGRIDL